MNRHDFYLAVWQGVRAGLKVLFKAFKEDGRPDIAEEIDRFNCFITDKIQGDIWLKHKGQGISRRTLLNMKD